MALTKLVGAGVPFHNTLAFAANPDPFTVRVNEFPPACADDGLRLLIASGAPAVIVKAEPFEVVPPAFTVTVAVPCPAIKLSPMVAVN